MKSLLMVVCDEIACKSKNCLPLFQWLVTYSIQSSQSSKMREPGGVLGSPGGTTPQSPLAQMILDGCIFTTRIAGF